MVRDAMRAPRSLPLLARRLDSSRVGTYMPCLPGVVIRRGRHRARSITGKTSKGLKELQRECQGGVRPAPWAGVPWNGGTRTLSIPHGILKSRLRGAPNDRVTCRASVSLEGLGFYCRACAASRYGRRGRYG